MHDLIDDFVILNGDYISMKLGLDTWLRIILITAHYLSFQMDLLPFLKFKGPSSFKLPSSLMTMFCCQKSRTEAIQDRDTNMRYYHLSTVIRRRTNHIEALQNTQGTRFWDDDNIKAMVRDFFVDLDNSTTQKIHKVSCKNLTKSKPAKGLGFRSMRLANLAFMTQLGWRLLFEKERLWFQSLESQILWWKMNTKFWMQRWVCNKSLIQLACFEIPEHMTMLMVEDY
ncbi:hypothetical protein Cgig2_010114 [Carnegiea gigantea]|uniref:Reverse transcriptase n=1 Tax=Carnegiea gigantea TaxID=171969 RepID=A0A9Q1GWR8_9CARY|nr:hypothetical protein Cgig2_010114 [Carnegiea gigantea]